MANVVSTITQFEFLVIDVTAQPIMGLDPVDWGLAFKINYERDVLPGWFEATQMADPIEEMRLKAFGAKSSEIRTVTDFVPQHLSVSIIEMKRLAYLF
jgi:hypothetical protein